MEGRGPCSLTCPRGPLWIIEFVWAHRMMDIQQVVDPSSWPDVGSQPLSVEDPWRLRVSSAQVYSIVKSRDTQHFERALNFLEDTHRLLPSLVVPIKHMKVMFGLKTLLIMWMLTERRGMVETSQHEMFLMRKNHVEFKALAQTLAMDKDKREDYITNHMEVQYGEHYAQKVEDRLLHYLQQLEAVLPGDTHIDKILRKASPVTEEEKLLLDVITSDSTSIAAALNKLLRCDVALCRRATPPQSSAHGKNGMESSRLSGSALHVSASKDLHESMEANTSLQNPPVVLQRGGAEGDGAVSLKNEDDTDVSRRQTEESVELVMRVGEDLRDRDMSRSSSGGVQEAPPSPQFCAKHQRWVESILQQCPEECSEELRDNVSVSPLLFQSPSSNTTSQDFTPSGLTPSPFDQELPPSETCTHLQTANPEQSSAPPGSSADPVLLPSPRDTQLPPHSTPAVRLLDITYFRRFCHLSKPHQAPFHPSTVSLHQQDACCSRLQVPTSPRCRTSGNTASAGGAMLVQHAPQNTTRQVLTAGSQRASAPTSCQPPLKQSFSKLSRKYRWPCIDSRASPVLDRLNQNTCPTVPELSVPRPPTEEASRAASPSSTSSQPVVPQNSFKPPAQNAIHVQPSYSTVVVSSPPPPEAPVVRVESSRVRRDGLRLSLHSQAVLLQSRLLQPCVPLSRLSAQECYRMTGWRSSSRGSEPGVRGRHDDNGREEEEEEEEGAFDPNILYSSYSSSSADDSMDPDYKPCLKKRRLLLEYETARTMGHT
ncbi:arginine-glutamic acid dipeptide repeats protein isoform X2 [Pseudochaenichthys georgianus]|uniref:arginine-glutamic acid dipeptide repeats protein isoform X2 n=1 Tax=Pseudochaenichthys georgianus TaxID=52239 RepID=UPI00146A7C99|nr:uncharacterized protein LOC117450146 isoform X2 [Pseudochaenichthys georgianus]